MLNAMRMKVVAGNGTTSELICSVRHWSVAIRIKGDDWPHLDIEQVCKLQAWLDKAVCELTERRGPDCVPNFAALPASTSEAKNTNQ